MPALRWVYWTRHSTWECGPEGSVQGRQQECRFGGCLEQGNRVPPGPPSLLPWVNLPMTEQAWSLLLGNQTSVWFSKAMIASRTLRDFNRPDSVRQVEAIQIRTYSIWFYKHVEVIQISTHNICFNEENQNTYHMNIFKYAPQKSSAYILLNCALIREKIYYTFSVIFKN